MPKNTKKPEYTIEEVEKHRSLDDFWTVIDNDVYNLTEFAHRHPGGNSIMMAAGVDATVNFHTHHFYVNHQVRFSIIHYL
jgi:cytochrome b involved in lipid metabolism